MRKAVHAAACCSIGLLWFVLGCSQGNPPGPGGAVQQNPPVIASPGPSTGTSGDSEAGAFEAAFQEHLAALRELERVVRRAVERQPIRVDANEFAAAEQRTLATRERLMSLAPAPTGQLSHQPTPLEAVAMRFRNEHVEATHRALQALRNTSNFDETMKPRLIALADRLEMRPPGVAPPTAVASAPPPMLNPAPVLNPSSASIPAPQPATPNATPDPMPEPTREPPSNQEAGPGADGLWHLTAEEFRTAQRKAGDEKLPFENDDLARVTGVVSSLSLREGIKRMTLAAGDGAISVWFKGDVDLSTVRPMQQVAVEGNLSIVSGLDNLPSVLNVAAVELEADDLVAEPPEVFLVFESAEELAEAGKDPAWKNQHRLIASMARPVVVSGKVKRIDRFQNEFLAEERLVLLEAGKRTVPCRMGRDKDAASIRSGQEVRFVGLLDLGFQPGRPKDEVRLKDCYLYPTE